MILVKKHQDTTTQKVVSTFLKRVKKSNLVARVRKTQHFVKGATMLQKRRKAIRRSNYESNLALHERMGKKMAS